MITVENLSFRYGRRRPAVFDDFSLTLGAGRVYGLLGRNGTGKSTLLYLLSGLLFPQQGAVRFRGADVARRQPEELSEIFLVPEEFSLPNVTLSRYVELNRPFYPRFSDELLARCLHDFDLAPDLHLGRLSMGQKKKAFMSFALATGTSLLLMDEPTNGLDIPSKSQFRRVVSSCMTDERTIVVSTHQVRDLENLIDPIIILDRSGLILNASIEQISEHLYFTMSAEADPDAYWSEGSLNGYYQVIPNRDGLPSRVNLEALFNATLKNKETFKKLFDNK